MKTVLVRRNAVPPRHQAHRDTRLMCLGNDRQLLGRRPAAPTSGPIKTSLFRLMLVIDTTLLLPLIEVGERVRSIRGLLHHSLTGIQFSMVNSGTQETR